MTNTANDPCGICHKNIPSNQRAIFCNNCNFYVHMKCIDLSAAEYKELEKESDVSWFCKKCTIVMFPFGLLTKEEFLGFNDFDLPSFIDSAPSFKLPLILLTCQILVIMILMNTCSRYFTLPELSSLQLSSNDFSILHTNIRSLSFYHDELVSLSAHTNLNLDVMGVSEIWHSNDNPISSNVDIPGYKFLKTKSVTQNDGVGLYIRYSLTYNPRIDLDSCTNDFETVWVEIYNVNDKNFLICCVYRHPSSNINNLTFHFQNHLSKLSSDKLLFIMGDFNVNLLDFTSHTPTSDFVNNFFSHSLLPCIHHPTRVSEHRASIIDNIYTNTTNANIVSGNILMQITDHFSQLMVLKNTHVSHSKSESLKYDYSKFVDDAFLEDFNQIDFNYLENSDLDINSKFDRFLKDLNTLTNKHAPIKRLSRKEKRLKDKPWLNKRILKMMRIRDRIL